MFKTYNVVESLWQMNLFATMQAYRNLSTLSYMAEELTSEEEAEETSGEVVENETVEQIRHKTAA